MVPVTHLRFWPEYREELGCSTASRRPHDKAAVVFDAASRCKLVRVKAFAAARNASYHGGRA